MAREDLELQAAALVELGARRSKFPLYFYEPAGQKHANFHLSQGNVRILAGGNRSGKTESNVAETIAACLGYRPWILRLMGLPLPDSPWIRPDNLPNEALVFNGAGVRVAVPGQHLMVSGLPMRKGIGEVIHPKVLKLAGPEGGQLIEKSWMQHGGVPGHIRFKNGSELFYASDEMDLMAFEGTNYASISIDEPIRRRAYTAIRRGAIDQFARITLTFTPIGKNSAWMFTDLYNERDPRKVEVFNVSIYDNKFLSPAAIEEFVNDPTLSELEKEARLFGKFMHLQDRIYTQFNPDVHVVEPFQIPRDWYVGMVVDPATVKPWFIAYFAVTPRGDIVFFKEWPNGDFTKIRRDGRSVEAYAQLIRNLDSDLPVQCRYLDPNYGPRTDSMRGILVPSIRDDIGRFGIHFDCSINDDLEFGEAKVRQLLAYHQDRPIDSLNRPRLYFTLDCPNLINSMLYYSFKTKQGGEDPDETKRQENYKDGADCVRYTAVKLADAGAYDGEWQQQWGDDSNQETPGVYGEPELDADAFRF